MVPDFHRIQLFGVGVKQYLGCVVDVGHMSVGLARVGTESWRVGFAIKHFLPVHIAAARDVSQMIPAAAHQELLKLGRHSLYSTSIGVQLVNLLTIQAEVGGRRWHSARCDLLHDRQFVSAVHNSTRLSNLRWQVGL